MTHKIARAYVAPLFASTSLFPMMRGPQVFYSEAPDPEPDADPTPDEFVEQPGDREPEGEAETVENPDPEPEDEGGAEVDPEEETDADPEDAEGEPEAEASAEPAAKPKDWRDRQIAKLRDKEKAKDEEIAELRRAKEAAEALLAATPEEREAGVTEETRTRIRNEEAAKVREEAYYKRINDGLEKMDEAGKKAFAATWDNRIVEAREALAEEIVANPAFLEAVTDLPNAAAVYHELTGDLDKLEAVLKMPAHKMGMELARLSDKLAKPAQRAVSRAPKPITPIERGGTERDLEDLINDPKASMAEIDRRMSAEERKRAKAH